MMTKQQRCDEVNKVILAISNHGRRFFYNGHHDRVASMYVAPNGHIYFIDAYTGGAIYVAYNGRWRKFTNGGTLRDLVLQFYTYISKDVPINIGYIGLYRRAIVDGDIWGYGDAAIQAVLAEVKDSPVFFTPKEPTP
jgi:hypothetical protein